MTQRYYLLSYCSPSRAGEHEVTIEAHAGKRSGTLKYRFKADGFGPTCDPNTPPDFDIGHPPPQAQAEGGEASGLKVKVHVAAPPPPKVTVTATATAAPAPPPPAPTATERFTP
jgi:hypothetical protein